jgi:hypothetical protein
LREVVRSKSKSKAKALITGGAGRFARFTSILTVARTPRWTIRAFRGGLSAFIVLLDEENHGKPGKLRDSLVVSALFASDF